MDPRRAQGSRLGAAMGGGGVTSAVGSAAQGGTPQPCRCVVSFFNLIVILLAVDMQSVAQLRFPDGAFGRARGTITVVVGAVRGSGLSRRVPPGLDGHPLGKPTTCSRRRTLCRCLAHPNSFPTCRANRRGSCCYSKEQLLHPCFHAPYKTWATLPRVGIRGSPPPHKSIH